MTDGAPVWFDFENTPQVLFLEPLMGRVRARGVPVLGTARPQAQTLELAAARGMSVEPVGRGDLTTFGSKIVGGLRRSAGLIRWIRQAERPRLLVSCSRTASLAACTLRIPSIALLDYEHSNHWALVVASEAIWMPDLLRDAILPARTRKRVRFFAGLKENLYLDAWPMDRVAARARVGLRQDERLVLARPPATTAHYAGDGGLGIWLKALQTILEDSSARCFVLPRTVAQREELIEFLPSDRVTIPPRAMVGPEIVGAADLILGGGGTMNREAAVLGIPAWSAFTGPVPYVDECLVREGRLRWVRTESELRAALDAYPEPIMSGRGPYPAGISAILNHIEEFL